jgi:hypothetical protein
VDQLLEEAIGLTATAAKTSWGEVAGAEAAAAVGLADRLVNLAETIRAGALDRVATSREHEVEGHRSAAAWMQQHCRTKKSTARRVQRLGRLLRHLPATDEAARRGEVSMDQVELIARLNQGRAAAGFSAMEPWLVDCARSMRFADLVDEVAYAQQALDPEGQEERAEKVTEDRFVNLVDTIFGCGDLTGTLEPITKAVVARELDRLERELFEEEWAEAKERLGREPTTDDLPNTAAQRRHDALGLMAQRSAAFTGRVGPACCVNLHLGWATFFAELGRLEGRDDLAYPEENLCELDDGTVLPASLAVSAALAGWVRRCVIAPDGEVLDYGRARRLFTAVQRQAVIAKTSRRRCNHPHGCDEPATRCHTDHVVEYEDGGRTDTTNGDVECPHHNRWKNRHKRPPPEW